MYLKYSKYVVLQYLGAKKITTELAPAWIPDDAATHCMICAKVKFSPIARKVS